MASCDTSGGGIGSRQEVLEDQSAVADVEVDPARLSDRDSVVVPEAQLFEAPDYMKSYGMPLAISCSVGYGLVGLVMVEPTVPEAMFHPVALVAVLLFAAGFVKGMQWWTTANESGKAIVCPRCGVRTRLDALVRSRETHTCRCGQDFLASR